MIKKTISIFTIILMVLINTTYVLATTYEYDALGRVTKVIYNDTNTSSYSYDAGGNIKTSGKENGIVLRNSFSKIDTQQESKDNVTYVKKATTLSESYKEQLNVAEKEIYNLFVNTFTSSTPSLVLETKLSYNVNLAYNNDNIKSLMRSIENAYSAFLNDYPEVFWIDDVNIDINKSGNNIISAKITVRRNSYFSDEETLKLAIDNVNKEVNLIVADYTEKVNNSYFRFVEQGADNYDKIKYIYSQVSKAGYVENGESVKHNIYGAFVLKESSSEGMARAFKLLCKKIGVECMVARGTSTNENGKNAYWCYAKIDGKWYLCDPCADSIMLSKADYGFLKAETDEYSLIDGSVFVSNGISKFTLPQTEETDYFVWGDANLDNQVTSLDSDYIIAYALSKQSFYDNRNYINSDVYKDGAINSTDAATIIQKLTNVTVTATSLNEGIAVTSMELSEFDKDNNGIFDADDIVKGVNSINNPTAVSTFSIRRSNLAVNKAVTREDILALFEKG